MTAHGSFTRVYLDGLEVSGYFNSSTWSAERAVEDVTTYQPANQAVAYTAGLQGGKASAKGFFDPTVLDPELQALRTAGAPSCLTIAYLGTANGARVNTCQFLESSYSTDTPVDKVIKISADWTITGPLTTGLSLTDLTAKTATGNDTSIDNTAASGSVGGAIDGWAQLHCTAVSGTTPSATVLIQHSTDNATWVTLLSFAAVTAIGAQRLSINGVINRYVRASWTISGTTPSLTFHVSLARL